MHGHPIRTMHQGGVTAEEDGRPRSESAEANPAALEWSLGRFDLNQGAFEFEDRTLPRAVRIDLADLDLSFRGLSTNTEQPADMELSALVNQAPLSIEGSFSRLT